MRIFNLAKYLLLILFPVMLQMTGCAAPTEYVNFEAVIEKQEFTPRKEAAITRLSEKQLVEQDYVNFGSLRVRYWIEKCDSFSRKSCTPVTHSESLIERLKQESANKGADLIKLTEENITEKFGFTEKTTCKKMEYVVTAPLLGSGGRPSPGATYIGTYGNQKQYCVEYNYKSYPVTAKYSAAQLWRHDPELSRNEKLRYALGYGTRREVKRLLGNKDALKKPLLDRETYPVQVILEKDNAEAIKAVLDLGVKPNSKVFYDSYDARNNKPRTYLLKAAVSHSATNATALLLRHGAKVAPSKNAGDVIYYFCSRNSDTKSLAKRKKLLKLLLRRGSNINYQEKSGKTALHQCVGYSDYDGVRLLVQHGANKKLRDDKGHSAASRAANYLKLVEHAYTKKDKKVKANLEKIIALLGPDKQIIPKRKTTKPAVTSSSLVVAASAENSTVKVKMPSGWKTVTISPYQSRYETLSDRAIVGGNFIMDVLGKFGNDASTLDQYLALFEGRMADQGHKTDTIKKFTSLNIDKTWHVTIMDTKNGKGKEIIAMKKSGNLIYMHDFIILDQFQRYFARYKKDFERIINSTHISAM